MRFPCFLLTLLAGAEIVCADDITTLHGEKFTNVTVTRTEPDGIVLMSSTGIIKVPFTDLSAELQQKYHYDPKAAAVFADRLNEQQRAIALHNAAARQQLEQRRAEAAAEEQAKKDAEAEKQATAALIARRIAHHEAWIGMTLEQASQALGEQPARVNRTVTETGVRLEWVFANGKRFTFDNGVLTSFDD